MSNKSTAKESIMYLIKSFVHHHFNYLKAIEHAMFSGSVCVV